jgi:LemA protein
VPVPFIVVVALVLVLAGVASDLFILISRRDRAVRSWRVVDTLLQRRHALIAMLLDDARGPEAGPVKAARRAAISAGVLSDPAGTARAEADLMTALARLIDAAGRDRGLRGDARLHAPMDRLRALDRPLRTAVGEFNDRVAGYHRAAGRFPGRLLTAAFGLRPLAVYATGMPEPEPEPAPRRPMAAPAGEPA